MLPAGRHMQLHGLLARGGDAAPLSDLVALLRLPSGSMAAVLRPAAQARAQLRVTP